MTIALISGSGFYKLPQLETPAPATIETAYGSVDYQRGQWQGRELVFIARHGHRHEQLSHQLNHRAHLSACKALGVEAIVACSIVGVVHPRLPLGQLLLPAELYFPDNRLPDGEPCTLFDASGQPGRGHLIAETHFNPALAGQLGAAARSLELPLNAGLIYGHVMGPRFNSRPEIRALGAVGVDMISQTLGPEAVLAGELEIPYAALCFGVDYANGVHAEPTPIATLEANMKASRAAFTQVLARFLQHYRQVGFEGLVYRFD